METGSDEEGVAPPVAKFVDGMPDDCPPATAIAAEGEVFRVVKNDPPMPEDFLTWVEEGKSDDDRVCESYGVSVFRDVRDAASYADKFPYLGDLIAKGVLGEAHGKIASTPRSIRGTPNSHSTWWPFDNVARHTIFAVVPEEL